MECKGHPKHSGIKVIRCLNDNSIHYAKVICKECRAWIKWLSKEDYDNVMVGTPRGEDVVEAQETDVERMERCIEEAKGIHVRCISKTITEIAIKRALQIAFKLYDGRE